MTREPPKPACSARAQRRAALALAGLGLWLGACVEEQRYVIENEAVALTAETPAAFVNEDDDEIFIVTRDFTLPVTRCLPLSAKRRSHW